MIDPDRPILSVEDSDEDFYSLTHTLKTIGVPNPVTRCASGRAAQIALDTEDGCAEARHAALILLDLNLPGADGRELLERFRQREKMTPVVVLSTSAHARDVERCYQAGANAYLVKPHDLSQWQDMLRATTQFWLRTVELPAPVQPPTG